jgi:hypothetical protein
VDRSAFAGYRFPAEVILLAVRVTPREVVYAGSVRVCLLVLFYSAMAVVVSSISLMVSAVQSMTWRRALASPSAPM